MDYSTKVIGADRTSMERVLTLAIRRAAGNEPELMRLAASVQALVDAAKSTQDKSAAAAVSVLLAELKAAAGLGPKVAGHYLEYKDCALALDTGESFQRRAARKPMEFSGFASTFGGEPDAFGDVIRPGAFAASLRRHKAAGTLPKLFFTHDPSQVPGKWLDMFEDADGLVAEGMLANTTLGRDLDELIKIEAIDALSIGFRIPPGGAQWDSDGVRILSEIDLHEVSLVSLPANPSARLSRGSQQPLRRQSPADALSAHLAELAELTGTDANVLQFPSSARRERDERESVDELQQLADSILSNTRRARR